jgi:outer membrane protein assembly factor BamD (BamD/ComL family)
MSIAGILSSVLFSGGGSHAVQKKGSQFQQEFQQLGQELQSGNLAAAQSDCAALQQLGPTSGSTAQTQTASPMAQDLQQLGQDLKSGDTCAAQQDYAKVLQDFHSQVSHAHHHHHHGGGGSEVSQLLNQLGQSLQAGNLAAAQQEYSSLQSTGLFPTSGPQSPGAVSFTA